VTERALRDAIATCAVRLHARGWVANHDGNVTARLGAGRVLATPTATSKAAITAAGLLVVDEDGKKLSGEGKPFSELGLHLTVYKNRGDVNAVVHAHPPAATGIACAGSSLLERPFIAEAVVSLGPSLPTVPYAPPGAAACAALAPFVLEHDAVLLANHGVFAWGADVEQAYLRLELVEHLAQIALHAEKVGGVRPLPESSLGALLEARRKAFPALAAAPRVAAGAPIVACAPSPTADVATIDHGAPLRSAPPGRAASGDQGDLARIIREEVIRSLRGS
jgi:L-fuculose-phosphate aldolase